VESPWWPQLVRGQILVAVLCSALHPIQRLVAVPVGVVDPGLRAAADSTVYGYADATVAGASRYGWPGGRRGAADRLVDQPVTRDAQDAPIMRH